MKAIIIADDVLSLRKVIKSIDAESTIELLKAFTSLNTVENYVSNNKIDVVFVDITSEKEEKINLIQKIRNQGKRIFIVLISDSKDDSYVAYNNHAIGFLLKPIKPDKIAEEIENIFLISPDLRNSVEIRTFGNFAVLKNNKIINFHFKKSKEILAYLIDKQGTQVDWPTLAAEVLDEDLYNKTTYSRLHRYVEELKIDLKKENINNILNTSKKGYLSVNVENFYCDLYAFMQGETWARNRFFGLYMYEYPWARDRQPYLENIINI